MSKKISTNHSGVRLPPAPGTIRKGSTLKVLLGGEAIECLANNVSLVCPEFDPDGFKSSAQKGLQKLEILQRGHHLSKALFEFLPKPYSKAVKVLVKSLTPPLSKTEQNGLGVFFYLPHVCFVSNYGIDPEHNGGRDPFDASMTAQYELTRRFSAEFSIRTFLVQHQARTLEYLYRWMEDPCPHVRRLCSEGTRPRLPWAIRIPSFMKDPSPCVRILEGLKDDPELYVRRSVANHVGDIAKDNRPLALSLCKSWLAGASSERRWVIRHALRYLAKKGDAEALKIRRSAE